MPYFFQELNLPCPIDDESKEKILNIKRTSVLRPTVFLTKNPEEFLNEKIIQSLSKINIFPDTMIVFGHVDNVNYKSINSLIHSDIIFTENGWRKVPFAINWELDEIGSILKWWDTSALPDVYPNDFSKNEIFRSGQGIHYGHRRNTDTSKMNCLNEYQHKKMKAVMIRTEIPHSVYYNSGFESRTSVSLRFPLDKIPSWESALNTFKFFVDIQN